MDPSAIALAAAGTGCPPRVPWLPGLHPALAGLLGAALAGAAVAPVLSAWPPLEHAWWALPPLLLAGCVRRSVPGTAALLLALLLLPGLRARQRARPVGEEDRAAAAEALLWQELSRTSLDGGRLRLVGRAWQREAGRWRALPGRLACWARPSEAGAAGLRLFGEGGGPFWRARAAHGNPGEVPPQALDWRAGRLGTVDGRRLATASRLNGSRPPRDPLADLGDGLQARLRAECGVAAPLLSALLLGRRERLPEPLSESFRACGLSHLLAVSGLHVALLAGAALLLLSALPLPGALRSLLLLALLLVYAPLTGGRPSVLRAAAMGAWLIGAGRLARPGGVGGALAWSAVVELAWRPEDLFDAGFLLSYGAVVALALAMPPLRRVDFALRRLPAFFAGPARWAAAGLGASLAATLGTAPPLLAIFGRLPLLTAPLNLPALPLGALLLAAGWLQLLLPLPGAPFGRASEGLAILLAELAGRAAEARPLTLVWRPAPLQALLLAFGLLLPLLPRGRPRLRLPLALASLLVALDLGPRLDRPRRAELLMIDVGQGDALLLRGPGGARWLVDTGWADPLGRGRDAGRDRILPLLERLAPGGLDGLVLSHPDQDHLGGTLSLLGGLPVDTVWFNGEWKANRSQDALRRWLARPDAPPTVVPEPGRRLLAEDGLRLRTLGPPAPGRLSAGNERSIVLRVEAGSRTALLPADAGHPAEAWLAGWGGRLHSELLKLGHHGSAHSSSPEFLELVAPRRAWISVGATNRYGHPTASVLEACADRGLPVHRSDRDGAAWLRAGEEAWEPVRRLPWCRPVGLRRAGDERPEDVPDDAHQPQPLLPAVLGDEE